ncbi:putative ubiquitin carboxyl-terminal hydrolase FAF-X isoform X1 [Brachionus plicatilis]|uniref:Putative ubiquitin carboxyl-terminal hydrolase FAF-X isoform X1 n=1 Tax=Brachionus plicatilis TaxID=10195 RepID=A0A3M7T9X0_BRAPC|nr:putative ubiquitin carboxyl-terminal hydrolase FAF-X isoform X1 [Brachionus plicatilis]
MFGSDRISEINHLYIFLAKDLRGHDWKIVNIKIYVLNKGPVNEWYEIIFSYAKYSHKARQWMINYFLLENPTILVQFLLDCPSNEIRNTLSKILVTLVHLSYTDLPREITLENLISIPNQPSITMLALGNTRPSENTSPSRNQITVTSLNNIMTTITNTNLSGLENKTYFMIETDSLVYTLISLISKRDLIHEQTAKYLVQYFQFFNYYLLLGAQQCLHLIRCDVPYVFIQFAIDELPMSLSNINLNSCSPSSGSSFPNYSKIQNTTYQNSSNCITQYTDLTKLYCVVSTLLRCFDIDSFCSTISNSTEIPQNPYNHFNELRQQENVQSLQIAAQCPKIPAKLSELILKRTNFVKKMLEEASGMDETIKLVKFLCWENMSFSLDLINELLWMTAFHSSYELKPHLEMLYHILGIADSWQTRRLMCALQGIANEREGLFDVILKSQNHFQKRAYQIIKMMVQLFTTSNFANDLLNSDEELKTKWKQARNWLYNEMERCRMLNMPNYSFYQSPQSNETSQTYYLERTQSARNTLEKALKICPQSRQGTNDSCQNDHNEGEEEEDEEDEEADGEEEAYESISDEENFEYRAKLDGDFGKRLPNQQ